MPNNELSVIISEFLSYIASERGLSPNTIEAYGRDIAAFVEYLGTEGVEHFDAVDQNHIVGFLSLLKSKDYASSSICRALIAIKVLVRFLKRESFVASNVTLYLESPKLWQLIPEVLSPKEVERLLSQPDTGTALGSRDRAILEVLYASGLRVSELCGLEIYDVDDSYVRVLGKGRKERLVPIGEKAIEAVDDYLMHYRCQHDSEKQQALFVSKTGRGIDRFTVWRMIKHYAREVGIVKNLSPHTLRHSFATHLLDNGADLRVIQEMLGHTNISSTDRYTHISQKQVKRAFDAFHPRPFSGKKK